VVQAKATTSAKAAESVVSQGNNTNKEQLAELGEVIKPSTLPSILCYNQGNKRHNDGENIKLSIIFLPS
jgi:hypothetical protein